MPFILLRLATYFGITLIYILATGTGAGLGYGIGHIGDDPTAFGLYGGLAGFGTCLDRPLLGARIHSLPRQGRAHCRHGAYA